MGSGITQYYRGSETFKLFPTAALFPSRPTAAAARFARFRPTGHPPSRRVRAAGSRSMVSDRRCRTPHLVRDRAVDENRPSLLPRTSLHCTAARWGLTRDTALRPGEPDEHTLLLALTAFVRSCPRDVRRIGLTGSGFTIRVPAPDGSARRESTRPPDPRLLNLLPRVQVNGRSLRAVLAPVPTTDSAPRSPSRAPRRPPGRRPVVIR